MLRIYTDDGRPPTGWLPGQERPEMIQVLKVWRVTATAGAAEQVALEFEGLPRRATWPPGSETDWYGDHARFIVANLRRLHA